MSSSKTADSSDAPVRAKEGKSCWSCLQKTNNKTVLMNIVFLYKRYKVDNVTVFRIYKLFSFDTEFTSLCLNH